MASRRTGQKREYFVNERVALGRTRPLPTWNKDRLLLVAKDRGYPTEASVVNAVGKELELSRSTVADMIGTGRFRWEQILVIGSMFEMSPREFCDVFLSGFFIEDNNGHFRCHINDHRTLLRPPKVKDKPLKSEEILRELEEI